MNTATQSIECPYCFGDGTWEVECCNGSYGCSCGGSPVHMGNCNVCKGTGKVIDGQYDIDANLKLIQGAHYIGSGPNDAPHGSIALNLPF